MGKVYGIRERERCSVCGDEHAPARVAWNAQPLPVAIVKLPGNAFTRWRARNRNLEKAELEMINSRGWHLFAAAANAALAGSWAALGYWPVVISFGVLAGWHFKKSRSAVRSSASPAS